MHSVGDVGTDVGRCISLCFANKDSNCASSPSRTVSLVGDATVSASSGSWLQEGGTGFLATQDKTPRKKITI